MRHSARPHLAPRHELARRALVRRRTGPPPPRAAANGANDAPDATTTTQHGLVVDEAAAPSSSATNSDVTTPTPTTKKPRFARLVEAPPSGAPGPAGEQPRSAAVPLPSTPPELEGLVLTESGDLIDAATGKPLPALGEPSRFDIKCAALRGDLDPPAWRPNTERAPAPLVAALLGPFPLDYEFNVVAKKTSPDQCPEALANELAAIVHSGAACPGPAPTTATTTTTAAEGGAGATKTTPLVTFKERMGGKFVSVCVTARVRSADLLEEGFAALAKDARVVMRY